jgi:Protein of unknown function (DUF2934)
MKTTGRKTVKGDKVSAPKAVKAASSKTAGEAKSAATEPTAAISTAMPASVPASKSTPPTYEEIAKRSYELYLARGSVDGHAEDDWARAEAELQNH